MTANGNARAFEPIAIAAMCAVVLIIGCGGKAGTPLVKNGKTPYTVVLPGDATPSERHAAEELASFIGQASGVTLDIVDDTDPQSTTPPRIFIGPTNKIPDAAVPLDRYGDEGFLIRTIPSSADQPDILIAGARKRGTMYGVYTFLETLGFRWYTSTITKIPNAKDLVVGDMNIETIPRIMYRVPYIQEAYDTDWAARNRVHSGQDSLNIDRGGNVGILGSHTLDRLVPPELYRTHPEYFPLIGGKRVTGYVQRCFSNPDVIRIAADNMIEWMDSEPGHTIFSLGQNDVERMCECPECTRILEEQEAPSGLFLHFANAVAERVAEVHPENHMAVFAYTFSEKPPKNIRPHENIIIRMAPIKMCFGHPFPECNDVDSKAFVQNLDGWAKLTDRIWVWHYCTDFPNYLMPFADFNEFTKDIGNYLDRGVNGIYFQGTYTTLGGADSELRAWLMAQLLWDPDRDPDALIDEWMAGVYGPAAAPMRSAFDLCQQRTADPDAHLYIYSPPTKEMWPDVVVASLDSLHTVAESLAASDQTALKQVRKNRLTVDYLKLILNTGVLAVEDGSYRPVGGTATTEEYDRFIERTKEFGITALREEGMDGSFYTQFRQRMETHPIATVENDDIRIDTVPRLGGRIVRIIDKKTGTNLISTGDSYYNYYPVYGGYDEILAWGWNCSGYGNNNTASLDGRTLTLTARNPNDLVFTKKITVPAQGRQFTIVSSIANEADVPQTYRLVCRMELASPFAKTRIEARMPNGSWKTPEPTEELDFFWPYKLLEFRYDGPNKPAGAWRLISDANGWTMENRFDPAQVETCIWHTCKAKDMVRMDLHTADREVTPGGEITHTHTWVIGDAK